MSLRERVNGSLDRVARPTVRVLDQPCPAYRTWGYAGLALAVGTAVALVISHGLALTVLAVIVVAAVGTFLGLALLTRAICGEETLVSYHHQIAVLAVAAGSLAMMRQPVLPYLDVTAVGIGVFLACGRVGCFMAGCCHGRPAAWGVCYRAEHAASGFTPYYVGVRLFPCQLVEAGWLAATAVAGGALIVGHRPAGGAFACYVVGYGVGRFTFEFWRGDADRAYYRGFSEAQWTALLLSWGIAGAVLAGRLPFQPWQVAAAVTLTLTMLAVARVRRGRRGTVHRLRHPRHIREVAAALEELLGPAGAATASGTAPVRLARTGLGVRISASAGENSTAGSFHYAMSAQPDRLTAEGAHTLAAVICELRHAANPGELIGGHDGVFHLRIRGSVSAPRPLRATPRRASSPARGAGDGAGR